MKALQKLIVAAGAAALLGTGAAQAALLTSNAGLGAVIDFDGFAGYTGPFPVPVGLGVSATASPGTLGANAATLGANGDWGAGKLFAAVGDESVFVGSLSFAFNPAALPNKAGAFINAYTESGPASITIEAFDIGGGLIDSQQVSVTTPGGFNAGAFYGIESASFNIATLRFTGDSVVLDDLAFAPIPEPSTYALMAAGLLALGAIARRRRPA